MQPERQNLNDINKENYTLSYIATYIVLQYFLYIVTCFSYLHHNINFIKTLSLYPYVYKSILNIVSTLLTSSFHILLTHYLHIFTFVSSGSSKSNSVLSINFISLNSTFFLLSFEASAHVITIMCSKKLSQNS